MGQSATGQISYGIPFDEGHTFPWSGDEYDDIEDWWFTVRGGEEACPVKQSQIFDRTGNWLGGKETPELIALWHNHLDWRAKWFSDNPLPVEVIDTYSYEHGGKILAVPGVGVCSGDEPELFDPMKLEVHPIGRLYLMEFFKEYGIEMPDQPGWFLSSCYG